jgi:hypothetical protein
MKNSRAELQIFEQSLNIFSVGSEHGVHKWHPLSQEDLDKLTTTL